ncbi:hypothetical protein C7N43_36940 [Sphingobacteriales bacterium UPWRP_1]|nr:hypothetical protein BVG80_11030 [Sphingobacteriales bacterium TSM_CSM]PSJ71903.1 hypothetical protein C7N43_36940 [Sphingobacteriales bacterium UPWRP_1]
MVKQQVILFAAGSVLLLFACTQVQEVQTTVSGATLLQPNKINILYFLDAECPISRQMTLYINKLSHEKDTAKVALLLVFQPPGKKRKLLQFLADYRLRHIPYCVNQQNTISKWCGASVTPEAFLYDAGGNLRYHGAINNLYAGIGSKRPAPTSHFLQANLDSLLAEKPLPFTNQPAVGCLIL